MAMMYVLASCIIVFSSTGQKYGRSVRVIPVDFTDGQEVYPQIAQKLQDLDIGILG